ncbi:pol protein [Cucumis melo var. makuwa]|uniref:Pol protein n=1 Tax=Cucumis melo var. makuwa TaxID=1194695 RepID=A0A5A7U6X1_CUCMM|nr:pol protein [Cucumis melo var. makuwa]
MKFFYYALRRFVEDFSRIASPLTQLTRKGTPFVWSPTCESSFQELKKKLVTPPVLKVSDRIIVAQPNDPYLIEKRHLVEAGQGEEFSISSDGGLMFERRLCVPADSVVKTEFLTKAYSSLFSMHLGSEGTKIEVNRDARFTSKFGKDFSLPWARAPIKGVLRFEKTRKLSPRFIGSFEILERIGPVAYHLALPPVFCAVHESKTLATPLLRCHRHSPPPRVVVFPPSIVELIPSPPLLLHCNSSLVESIYYSRAFQSQIQLSVTVVSKLSLFGLLRHRRLRSSAIAVSRSLLQVVNVKSQFTHHAHLRSVNRKSCMSSRRAAIPNRLSFFSREVRAARAYMSR